MSHPQYRHYITVSQWERTDDLAWLENEVRVRLQQQGMDPQTYVVLYDHGTHESAGEVIILDAAHRDDLLSVLRQRHRNDH